MLGVFLSDPDLDSLLATLSQLEKNKARKLARHAISNPNVLPTAPKAPAPAQPSGSPPAGANPRPGSAGMQVAAAAQ